jgi:hypothetical protein
MDQTLIVMSFNSLSFIWYPNANKLFKLLNARTYPHKQCPMSRVVSDRVES